MILVLNHFCRNSNAKMALPMAISDLENLKARLELATTSTLVMILKGLNFINLNQHLLHVIVHTLYQPVGARYLSTI